MKLEVYNSGKHAEYCQLYQFACMSSEPCLGDVPVRYFWAAAGEIL
jgi:hypothetical protein